MTTCEQPCEAQKAHATAVKWVYGISMTIVGGAVWFCLAQSARAERKAAEAKERASEIDSINVRITSLQEDVSEFKKMGAIIHGTDKNVAVILEKIKQIERGE